MDDTPQPLETRPGKQDTGPLSGIPVEIMISVGRSRPTVRELLSLKPESVLALDRKIDDPVELYIGEKLIARGELQEAEGDGSGQLAVRLTEIADLGSGLT